MEEFLDSIGHRSPEMLKYPLMNSPVRTVIFSSMYLLFIKVIGPSWMKNKRPFDLRTPMMIYNFFLVALSSYIFLGMGFSGWFTTYNWRCQPLDESNSPAALHFVYVCWLFYISKILEYMDTIFFVLRKKDNQVNFLHVFHHSTVPITTWIGVSYGPGGSNTIFMIANAFVHIWMYLYYALAAFGPGIQKYLWWKKYITTLQLVQFIGVFFYFVQLRVFPYKDCTVPTLLFVNSVGQAIIYFILFSKFYIQTYRKKKHDKTSTGSSKNGYAGSDRKKM